MKNLLVILLVYFFAAGFNMHCAFAYPSPVAVITNYNQDDLAGKISIIRANGQPSGSEKLLYPNDQITGEYFRVKVECHPHAKVDSTGTSYIIKYTPPSGLEKVTGKVLGLIDSFWHNVEYFTRDITKGASDEINLKPQPGFDVTLMSGKKVIFSWYNSTNKPFLIKDDKGKKIFEKKINNLTSIELNVDDLKLQSGKQYFWSVEGEMQNCKMTLLDKKTETEILSMLAMIDSENLTENERIFKKVTYLQYLSDTYPEQIDLYWLSAQWLFELKTTTSEEDKYRQFLLDKCSHNLINKYS